MTVDPASASFTVQHTYRLSNTASDETFTGFFEIFLGNDVTASVGGVHHGRERAGQHQVCRVVRAPPEPLTPDSARSMWWCVGGRRV